MLKCLLQINRLKCLLKNIKNNDGNVDFLQHHLACGKGDNDRYMVLTVSTII